MSDAPERKAGKMIFYVPARGFGFIAADNCDVFMHISNWCENAPPQRGESVSFIEGVGRDGRSIARLTRTNGKREDFIRPSSK
jgi:cold shock CspA family protein